MGFDAGNSVEPLDYDFSSYIEGVRGTISEPTQDDLDAFFLALRNVGSEAGVAALESVGSGEDAREALAGIPDDLLSDLTGKLVAAVAGICKGTPSEGEINALPVRPRQAFVDWVIAETTNPTKRTSASRASVVRSNGAALLS